MQTLMKKNILGVDMTDASRQVVLEYVFDFLKESKESMYIVTPNPEIVMYSLRHPAFREIVNRAGVSLCDGVGLFWAGGFLGKPLKERITGVDFMDDLCRESAKNAVSVGFLGGRKGVAERTAECLKKKYPSLKVTFTGERWADSPTEKGIDILFVAYGFPKQEEWMHEHTGKLQVRVMMGVGGAFDYISGEVGRAPKAVRDMGLEWLYRLIRQPRRLKRQLVLPQFIFTVFHEKMKKS